MRRTSLCSLLLFGLVCGERIPTPLHAADVSPVVISELSYTLPQQIQIRELMKSALAGDAEAQFKVAVCYGCGYGVSQDYVKAALWYHRAAEQGNTQAQYRLSAYYKHGVGVAKDAAKAAYWYRQATAQRHANASLNPNTNGYGIPPDYDETARRYYRATK